MTVSVTDYAFFSMGAYDGSTTPTDPPGEPAGLSLDGWEVLPVTYNNPQDPDFSATAYRNTTTNEVVIAYRGASNGLVELGSAAIGTELRSQASDAYAFYLAAYSAAMALSPLSEITFTGHSLGGGLAAMMSALTASVLGEAHAATVFAPVSYGTVVREILHAHETYEDLGDAIAHRQFEVTSDAPAGTFDHISLYRIPGEAASSLGFPDFPNEPVGGGIANAYAGFGAFQLHNMSLHAILLEADKTSSDWIYSNFQQVLFYGSADTYAGFDTAKLALLDAVAASTAVTDRNVLTGLLADQTIIGGILHDNPQNFLSDDAIATYLYDVTLQAPGLSFLKEQAYTHGVLSASSDGLAINLSGGEFNVAGVEGATEGLPAIGLFPAIYASYYPEGSGSVAAAEAVSSAPGFMALMHEIVFDATAQHNGTIASSGSASAAGA